MRIELKWIVLGSALLSCQPLMYSQVYSPRLTAPDQIDTTDLVSTVQGIYRNAHAVTDREKAEAIWRYLLTDGRFVKPGIFYHIPGWSYEEPKGEVLDPVKLLNSYGFGLCYQDGPLIAALWDAGGFKHSRVWFLVGHTIAEVFYDGQYHMYDSDELGYTTIGDGPVKESTVASVQQLQADKNIIRSKLKGPHEVKPGAVDYPWYNADVRDGDVYAGAEMFNSSINYLYGYKRYAQGHTMDFMLRPGERIIRYYKQPDAKLFYLPYKTDGENWAEFPKDWGGSLLVQLGPHSEKDPRLWSTGVIEYQPTLQAGHSAEKNQVVYSVASPYVIIGAKFSLKVALDAAEQKIVVETSTDDGHTWTEAAAKQGPFSGAWELTPKLLAKSEHGELNAVQGTYGYLIRVTGDGAKIDLQKQISDLKFATIFEFNPRTLPVVAPGENTFDYASTNLLRHEIPVHAINAQEFALKSSDVVPSFQAGQGYLQNATNKTAELIFKLSANGSGDLNGVDVGGRFLDLTGGIAPDKLTAETRKIAAWPTDPKAVQSASIAWSLKPEGPWTTLWSFDPKIKMLDGNNVKQILRWPEVDRSVRDLNVGSDAVYVRYQFENLAVDDIRLATVVKPPSTQTKLSITHIWTQDGKQGEFTEDLDASAAKSYQFDAPSGKNFENVALVLAAH